jgi:Tfp pilus assembly protein PilF
METSLNNLVKLKHTCAEDNSVMKKNTIESILVLAITFCLLFSVSSCATGGNKSAKAEALRKLGEAYIAKNDYTAALKELIKAQEFNPKDHLVYDDMGRVFLAKKRYELAIEHFKKAIEIKPDFIPGKNNLGSAYLMNEDWDKAIEVFNSIKSDLLYATPHFPLNNLGWAYYNKKDYQNAEKYYARAIELKPQFTFALRGLGLTYLETGRLGDAIALFEKALKDAPDFQRLQFDLGKAYVAAKKYDKAVIRFKETIRLAPESKLAENAMFEIKKLRNK